MVSGRDCGVQESLPGGTNVSGVKTSEKNFKETVKSFNQQMKQKITLKPVMTVGRSKGTTSIATTPNLEFSSMCRRKNLLPIPPKHTDVTMTMHEKRIDDCWDVDVDRNLSHSRTGFTKFTLLSEKPPKGYMSRRLLTKIQAISRAEYFLA